MKRQHIGRKLGLKKRGGQRESETPAQATVPRGLQDRIVPRSLAELRPYPGNPRSHPEVQIARLMKNIKRRWTNPILIDEIGTILAGHARCEAAARLGMSEVPTITIAGLSDSEKRAIVISDNRLPEAAVWDFELLRGHFKALIDVDFDVELTGFSTGEVDLLLDGASGSNSPDPADGLASAVVNGPAVSRADDIWLLGRHRLICGNALLSTTYKELLRGEAAQMAVTDPPFNVPMHGHATGRGSVQHREFRMASGEMSPAEFTAFLTQSIQLMYEFNIDGSIHFIFMDWRHLPELLAAALPVYADWKNLLVWNKSNAGQGSFYRSKHELIGAFKKGRAQHINNFGLGAEGRHRANVLDYPSVNSLHPARAGDLALHPTVKPVALIADLIRDCSRRNGVILDPFGGSGTTILAAERTGRIARVIELEPICVDVAINRWERVSGIHADFQRNGCPTGG